MAKIQLKSDNINPFGGLFSILNIFNRSGLRSVIDRHLGRRGMPFLRMFVVVPAKWIKSGRGNVLNLYTKRRIYLELIR